MKITSKTNFKFRLPFGPILLQFLPLLGFPGLQLVVSLPSVAMSDFGPHPLGQALGSGVHGLGDQVLSPVGSELGLCPLFPHS